MTVASTTNTAFYVGNGVTTSFSAPFYFQLGTDLLVQTYDPVLLITNTYTYNAMGPLGFLLSPSSPTDPNFGWPTGANVILATDPASGIDINIYRQVEPLQSLSIPASGPFPSKPIEAELDRLTMAIQDEETFRDNLAVTIPLALEGTFNPALPAAIGTPIADGCAIIINSTNNGFSIGPNAAQIAGAQAFAAAAAASAVTATTEAGTATTQASVATTQASAATTQAGNAATSAAAAAASAAAVTWQQILFVNHASSPITVDHITGRGTLYVVDASAGAVIINLPQISTLSIPPPFSVGVKKEDSSTNNVTVIAFSGDTIDLVTSLVIPNQNQSVTFSAEEPTAWISQGFGTVNAVGVSASNVGHTYLTGISLQSQLNQADAELVVLAAVVGLLPGTILAYGSSTIPAGYLACDGASYVRATFPALSAVLNGEFGFADGTHFNVPDLRGRFLRGWDSSAGRDPNSGTRTAMNTGGATGNAVGSVQLDAMQGHFHSATTTADVMTPGEFGNAGASGNFIPVVGSVTVGAPTSDGPDGTPRTSPETRPLNAYIEYIIKT